MLLQPDLCFVGFVIDSAPCIGFFSHKRIEVGNDIAALFFIEIDRAFEPFFTVALNFDEQGIATPNHVPDDTRRPDTFRWINLVETDTDVPGTDVENANCTCAHYASFTESSPLSVAKPNNHCILSYFRQVAMISSLRFTDQFAILSIQTRPNVPL